MTAPGGSAATTVLIVDRDPTARTILTRALQRLGCRTEAVATAPDALTTASSLRPAVILAELQPIGLDCVTFIGRLVQQGSDAAVVVTSAQSDLDAALQAFRAGAVDLLKRPWNPAELAACLTRALAAHQQRQKLRTAGVHQTVDPGAPASPGRLTPTSRRRYLTPPGGVAAHDLALVTSHLKAGTVEIPAIPSVLVQLRTLINREDVGVEDVATQISHDQRLTTTVLRLANSAAYARGRRNADLREAVRTLGFRQVHALVETVCTRDCFPIRDPRLREVQGDIWRHSVAKALAMRALAELVLGSSPGVDADTAHVAGLLSDVGASLILWIVSERAQAAPPGPSSAVDVEATVQLVREYHERIGGAVLTQWKLPQVLVDVASGHHAVRAAGPSSHYWDLSALGSYLADAITGTEDITARVQPDEAAAARWMQSLRLNDDLIARITPALTEEIQDVLAEVG